MKVLCIDPGPHVGVASVDTEEVNGNPRYFNAGEATPEDVYGCIEKWVEWADVVVVEDFRIGGARGVDSNVTIEMIGAVRYVTEKAGKKFVRQPPGAHKFAQGAKLRRIGWYTKGSDHARSATGHLVKFLCDHGAMDASRLLPSAAEKED